MRLRRAGLLALSVLAAFALPAGADEPDAFCLRVDRLHTGEEVLEDALLFVRDGKVAAILMGQGVTLPPELRVVDRRGHVAIPGMVLAQLQVDGRGGGRAPETLSARFRALDAHDPFAEQRELLAAGITSAFLHPGRGRLVTGEGAVVKLGGPPAQRVLRARAEACLELGEGALGPPLLVEPPIPSSADVPIVPGERQRPTSRLGLVAELSARIRAALEYGEARAGAAGDARPELDLDLEAFGAAVLAGRLRVDARRRQDLRALLQVARDLELKPVVAGATEVYALLDELAELGAPVVYEPSLRLRGGAANRGENPDRLRPRADTPARLARAGIPFAIAPAFGHERDLRLLAALAVRGGLAREQALAAITHEAARVLGVGERVGSLRPGLDADFLILNGDPLATASEVVETWIGGERVYRAPGSDALLIRAGTILTAAGDPIRDGELLIEDGHIAAVGSEVPHPRGARVIDAGPQGVVTPGFIDAFGHLGLRGDNAAHDASVPLHRVVAVPGPAFARVARSGVTSVLLTPRRLHSSGSRGVLLKTAPSGARDPQAAPWDPRPGMVLRDIAAAVFDLSSSDPLKLPSALKSRLGAAEKYISRWKKYETELAKWKAEQAKKQQAEAEKRKAEQAKKKPDEPAKKKDEAKDSKDDKKDEEKKKDEEEKDEEPAKPDPVSGTWEFTISGGPMPEPQEGEMLLKLGDDRTSITGVVRRKGLPGEVGLAGTLEGTTVTLELDAQTPAGKPKVVAELEGEDVMNGSLSFGPFSLSFEARRTEREVPEIKLKTRRRSKEGRPLPPPVDEKLEPLRRVLEGRAVLVLRVKHPRIALSVLEELKKRDLRAVFLDFPDADLVAKELRAAGAGVLLRPESLVRRDGHELSPAVELARAGLPLGFFSDAEDGAAELPLRALAAVSRGLAPGKALSALTLDAARQLGVAERVGSLEVGKDGDVLIFDGPPFEATTRLKAVVVGGRPVPMEEAE